MTFTGSLALDAAAIYRPSDASGLRHAAVLLARQGLTARDIATALKLTPLAVQILLEDQP